MLRFKKNTIIVLFFFQERAYWLLKSKYSERACIASCTTPLFHVHTVSLNEKQTNTCTLKVKLLLLLYAGTVTLYTHTILFCYINIYELNVKGNVQYLTSTLLSFLRDDSNCSISCSLLGFPQQRQISLIFWASAREYRDSLLTGSLLSKHSWVKNNNN